MEPINSNTKQYSPIFGVLYKKDILLTVTSPNGEIWIAVSLLGYCGATTFPSRFFDVFE